MKVLARLILAELAVAVLALGACASLATTPESGVREALAPSGKLRVGLYPGTPTSFVSDPDSNNPRGVGHDLGRVLAQRLDVPFEPVVLATNGEVLAALKAGIIDLAFTNATAERAKEMDFSPVLLEIELGYLVRAGSPVTTLTDIDRPGVRVGVTAKSSSDGKLTRDLKQASIARVATVKDGTAMLAAREIDAYATNKATLYEMSDQLGGSRVLDGRWGVEEMALAVPKGRDAGIAYLRRFVDAVKADGQLKTAIARAGLRGAVGSESVETQ